MTAVPDAAEAAAETPRLVLGRLGGLLLDAGLSVTEVREALVLAARGVGEHDAVFSVLPQMVIASDARTGAATVATGVAAPLSQRQAVQAILLSQELHAGAASLSDAAVRIPAIKAMVRRHPLADDVVGTMLVSAGLAVLFRCPWWAVLAATIAGGIVGVLTRLMNRHGASAAILPFAAALVSTAAVGGAARLLELGQVPLFAVCAPIAVLVPGALITNALLELTATDIITGSARLSYGVIVLGFMAAGIAAGAALTGLRLDAHSAALVGQISGVSAPGADSWAAIPPLWLSWIGILVLAVGVGLVFDSGPLLTVVTVAAMACTFALLLLLTPLTGKAVATGLTVAVVFIASRIFAGFFSAVPATASFQPAFLLLVPGSVGLIALAGVDEGAVTTALGIFAALCIGTKIGAFVSDLSRPARGGG